MRTVHYAAVLLALTGTSTASAQDTRVATKEFAADQVVVFTGKPGFQSTIEFETGERVENIAIGDSAAWQVTPNRRANLIFVKPSTAFAATTNMTVVTDRRTYLFELRTDARAGPTYLLRFAYADTKPAADPALAQPPAAAPTVETLLSSPASLNFAWTMSGARDLYPARVFDDGRSVYIAWGKDRTLPAILAPAPDGKGEGPVNYTTSGDYLVVDGRHDRLIVRFGDKQAQLRTARSAVAVATATESALSGK